MKNSILLLLLVIITNFSFGQDIPQEYSTLIRKAFSLYSLKDYKNSALTYSAAFKANGWKAKSSDRYNAACSWALAEKPDSAFFQLEKIASELNYSNYGHLITDPDLKSLYLDKRWESLLVMVKKNKENAEANLNKPIVAQLDSIYFEDQKYRLQIKEIEEKFGWESKEMKDLWTIIDSKDSINLITIKAILDKEGWLGADVVGEQGNSTLFLVIQHSNQSTQEKYLPMMRNAVKNGKAKGSDLALLEDRVALGQGKKQIFGSQISQNMKTQLYYIRPIEDPDNVDRRRAEVGLDPIADYVSYWQIKWDLERYKKDLPAIEQLEKFGQ